jgi:hypothetical protein
MAPTTPVEDILFRDGYFAVLTEDESLRWYQPVEAQDGALTMNLYGDPSLRQANAASSAPVAARYLLVSSSGRNLLMVRRMRMPHRVQFQIACRDGSTWVNLHDLHNQALFLARGCSRAIETSARGRIFFVDDAERFHEGMQSYSSKDIGMCLYHPERRLNNILPKRTQAGRSPWSWRLHTLATPSQLVEVPVVAYPESFHIALEVVFFIFIAALYFRFFVI